MSFSKMYIKAVLSRPRYSINFTLYCSFLLIQGCFKCFIQTKHLLLTQYSPPFLPLNPQTFPLRNIYQNSIKHKIKQIRTLKKILEGCVLFRLLPLQTICVQVPKDKLLITPLQRLTHLSILYI